MSSNIDAVTINRILLLIIGVFAMGISCIKTPYRRYWVTCAILILGGLLFLFVGDIGTTVDANNFIHEAGIFLPVGGISIVVGMMGIIILIMLHLYNYFRSSK